MSATTSTLSMLRQVRTLEEEVILLRRRADRERAIALSRFRLADYASRLTRVPLIGRLAVRAMLWFASQALVRLNEADRLEKAAIKKVRDRETLLCLAVTKILPLL